MAQNILQYQISKITLVVLFGLLIWQTYYYSASPFPLGYDTMGYHVYFVEWITDGDLRIADLSYYEGIQETYQNTNSLYQFVRTPDESGYMTKYPFGWTIMNLPFLYFGHLWGSWFGYATDGFSAPYQHAVTISSFFYTLIGLIFLRHFLKFHLSEKATAFALIILVGGTNFYHIVTGSMGMPHIYLFPLYAALLLYTHQFYHEDKKWSGLKIGLILGLIFLIRPVDIVACLIPILYGIHAFSDLKTRITSIFINHRYRIVVITFILISSIQLLVWKYVGGSFFTYSYSNNNGEGLDLLHPHTIDFLFSFRKGWWIYTPVMLLIIPGFMLLYRKKKDWFWSIFIFTIVYIYLVSSWSTWWYAGSFSQRPMEHVYPVMIFILMILLINVQQVQWKRYLSLLFVSFCIILNIFQTWQAKKHIIHPSRMTMDYYFSVLGQTTPPREDQLSLLLIDRKNAAFNANEYNVVYSFTNVFESPGLVDTAKPYFDEIKLPFCSITDNDYLWVIASADMELVNKNTEFSQPPEVFITTSMQYNGKDYGWLGTPPDSIENGKMTIKTQYLTPEIRLKDDLIRVSIWNASQEAINIHRVSLQIYEKR